MWTQEAYWLPISKSFVRGYLLWLGVPTLARGTYLDWEVPTLPGGGVPILARQVPTLAMGVPTLARGTYRDWGVPTLPGGGVPILARQVPTLARGTYLDWGVPTLPGAGVPILARQVPTLAVGVPTLTRIPPGVDRHLWKQYLPIILHTWAVINGGWHISVLHLIAN